MRLPCREQDAFQRTNLGGLRCIRLEQLATAARFPGEPQDGRCWCHSSARHRRNEETGCDPGWCQLFHAVIIFHHNPLINL
jgi:hypothetical protein